MCKCVYLGDRPGGGTTLAPCPSDAMTSPVNQQKRLTQGPPPSPGQSSLRVFLTRPGDESQSGNPQVEVNAGLRPVLWVFGSCLSDWVPFKECCTFWCACHSHQSLSGRLLCGQAGNQGCRSQTGKVPRAEGWAAGGHVGRGAAWQRQKGVTGLWEGPQEGPALGWGCQVWSVNRPQRRRCAVASPISQGSGGQCRVTVEPMSLGAVSVTCTNHYRARRLVARGVWVSTGEHDCWCPPCRCCSHRSLDGPPQCLCVRDLQGCFLSSANVCVVKVEGTPHLCKTDEVGEICVDSSATATAYYGLLGITKNVFEVPAGPTAVAGGWARRAGGWPSSGCL